MPIALLQWSVLFSLVLNLMTFSPAGAIEVRVLILESSSQVTLSSEGPLRVTGGKPFESEYKFPAGEGVIIKSYPGGWRAGDQEFTGNGLRVESDPPGLVRVNSRAYRGELVIRKERENGIRVINALDLEDYLRGVIREEISPQWPIGALKAQAVVARTYALRQILDNKDQSFDLRCTTESQMYGGQGREDPRCDLAVENTQGIILTYEGKPVTTFYHAACGGHTEDASYVWSYNHSSLQGVPCSYCWYHPVYVWQISLKKEDIRRALARLGYPVKEIEAITPLTRTKTNRILRLEIRHDESRILMEGKKFRQAMGYELIRSTNFTVKKENGGFTFSGKGWGHGVGLCQWGAKGMADRAFSYEAILQHYYPGARLSRLGEVLN